MVGNTWRTAHKFCLRASYGFRDRGHVVLPFVVACCISVRSLPSDIWKCEDESAQNCKFMRLLNNCWTWPLTLRDIIGTGCAGMRRWGLHLGPRGMKWQEAWGNRIMRSFVICATNTRQYIKQLLWAGHEVRMWEKRQAVGKREGKRQRV